jgi:hypothetical protein
VGLIGAEHFAFTGPCASVRRVMAVVPFGFCEDPTWNRASARDVAAHHVTAFLAAELTGDTDAAASLATYRDAGGNVSYQVRGYGK